MTDPSLVQTAAPFAVADLRAYLVGAWRLTRAIEDRRTGQRGRLEGRAVFEAEGDGLVYREEGRLVLGAFETLAHRAYRYAFPVPHLAEVLFEDGRAFHGLDLSAGAWTATHRCGRDLYEGDFRAEGPDAWRARWRVTGPRKDQRLDGLYERVG
jgi:hypothetical protein